MSTISQALLKNKFEQTGGTTPVMQVENKTIRWKVAFSIAVLIIIALLSVLTYLQLYPHNKVKQSITMHEQTKSPTALASSPAPVAVLTPAIDKTLVKMTFDTQPIPEPIKVKEIKVVKERFKTLPAPSQPVTVVSSQVASQNTDLNTSSPKILEEAEMDDVAAQVNNIKEHPSDLQKRFDLAVLLTEMEQNEEALAGKSADNLADSLQNSFEESFDETNNDGSDIHLMSSNFQNKIPLIGYDAHVYSSLVSERWIRINGEKLVEGSFDSTGKLELIEIQPQRSIFRVGRQSFSLESLTDWKGY
tara:strand:+ start:1009 stop:1920 length:912 start_codon:yes stop_codon:yes gene_type:complete